MRFVSRGDFLCRRCPDANNAGHGCPAYVNEKGGGLLAVSRFFRTHCSFRAISSGETVAQPGKATAIIANRSMLSQALRGRGKERNRDLSRLILREPRAFASDRKSTRLNSSHLGIS